MNDGGTALGLSIVNCLAQEPSGGIQVPSVVEEAALIP